MEKTLNELFKNAKLLAKDYHKGQLDKGGLGLFLYIQIISAPLSLKIC